MQYAVMERNSLDSRYIDIPNNLTWFYIFSPSKIQGMIGGHGVGGACSHIKVFWLSPFPHQREFCTEGLLGQHALGMLGRTLV